MPRRSNGEKIAAKCSPTTPETESDAKSLEEHASSSSAEDVRKGRAIYNKLHKVQDSDEESLTEKVSNLNVSEGKDESKKRSKIVTCLDKFTSYVENKIPTTPANKNQPKVLILHSEPNSTIAKDLSRKLCDHPTYSSRAIFVSQVQPLFSIHPYDLRKAAYDWAEVIVIIIDNSWLDDTENVDTSAERSHVSLVRKYEFACLQNTFVNNASLNTKIIVIHDGEGGTRGTERVELRNSYHIEEIDRISIAIKAIRDWNRQEKKLKSENDD